MKLYTTVVLVFIAAVVFCTSCAFMAPRKVEHVIVCAEERVSLSLCKEELEKWQKAEKK